MLLYAPAVSLKTTEHRHFRSTLAMRMPWASLAYVNETSRGHTPRLSFLPLFPLPGWPLHTASTLGCKMAATTSFMSNRRDQLPHIAITCFENHLGLDFMKIFELMSVASRLASDRRQHWNWLWGRTSQDPAAPLQKPGDRSEGERYPLMLTEPADVTALYCSSSKWQCLKQEIPWSGHLETIPGALWCHNADVSKQNVLALTNVGLCTENIPSLFMIHICFYSKLFMVHYW